MQMIARRFLVWCAIILLLGPAGCVPNRPARSPSPSELANATTGTIGVVPAWFSPEIYLVTVTQSRALGAVKGAGLGFLQGAAKVSGNGAVTFLEIALFLGSSAVGPWWAG